MRSIKTEISGRFAAMLAAACLSLAVISSFLCQQTVLSSLQETLVEIAHVNNQYLCAQLEAITNISYETGSVARLANAENAWANKQSLIENKVKHYNFVDYNLINANGISEKDGQNYADTPYFKAAMQGQTYISEPGQFPTAVEKGVIIAAPLWQDGLAGTSSVGCVYFVPQQNFLNEIIATMDIGETGTCVIINSEGGIIAAEDGSRVLTENALTDGSQAADMQGLLQKAITGQEGFGSYHYNGQSKLMAFHPIENGSGWSLLVTANRRQFTQGITYSGIIMTMLSLCFVIIGVWLTIRIIRKITGPVTSCAQRLQLLAQGDLRTPVEVVHTRDEIQILTDAAQTIVQGFNTMISDAGYLLREMSNGNFAIKTRAESSYSGDFKALLLSMREINTKLSKTLEQINTASDQVATGAEQVASGAQALSQGAAEQAGTISALATSMETISEQINFTADFANAAGNENLQSHEQINVCSDKMQQMVGAMDSITQKSSEIGKIIKTIEDIAFQTNILALNAAVEAARAGEAGKGFAVVADEVRSLAAKSGQAAKDTTALIEQTIQAVNNGAALSEETKDALDHVIASAEKVSTAVTKIRDATQEQTQSVQEVVQGVDQISVVVQTNSATAEESAAASEEMSGQSQMLKELVGQFKLKRN